MIKIFAFQKLEIYQLAKVIVTRTYAIIKAFPDSEKYAFSQQMARSAVSVPSNIAEGYGRDSVKDKKHFLNIAYSSLLELVCQYEIARDLNYIDDQLFQKFMHDANVLAVKISNFRRHYEERR